MEVTNSPKMQAAHRQVGCEDLQRPSFILTRNEGIFRGLSPDLMLYLWVIPCERSRSLRCPRDRGKVTRQIHCEAAVPWVECNGAVLRLLAPPMLLFSPLFIRYRKSPSPSLNSMLRFETLRIDTTITGSSGVLATRRPRSTDAVSSWRLRDLHTNLCQQWDPVHPPREPFGFNRPF